MAKEERYKLIEDSVKRCKKCRLCETALNAVVGEGTLNASVVFIGEAPGALEDQTGRPFVGRAGKLLDSLLLEIGLKREDVWIGNIIKHRPPENRDPLPDELSLCSPFLAEQLKIIEPKLIVTLGRFSMNFFHPDGKISLVRGKVIKTDLYNIYPVYHPAAGLRNPKMMSALREDFMRIPEVLNTIAVNSVTITKDKKPL